MPRAKRVGPGGMGASASAYPPGVGQLANLRDTALSDVAERDEHLGMREYWLVLTNRKWLILQVAVAAVVLAVVFSLLQMPTYDASAQVVATQPDNLSVISGAVVGGSRGQTAQRVGTQIVVLESPEVARRAAEKMTGLEADPVGLLKKLDVTQIGDTDVIEIRVSDADPNRAADIANAVAAGFVEFEQEQSVAAVAGLTAEIESQLSAAQAEFDRVDAEIDALSANPANIQRARALQPERDASLSEMVGLRQQLNELKVQGALQRQFVTVVKDATAPESPTSPTPVRNAVLAGALGLIVGALLAFGLDLFDDTVRDPEQLEDAVDAPVLGSVPQFRSHRGEGKPLSNRRLRRLPAALVAPEVVGPHTRAAEAFRRLRVGVEYLSLDHPARILGVTSAQVGEGKSTVALNLAASLVHAGIRTTLVDADLRRPSLDLLLESVPDHGIASILSGKASVADATVLVDVGADVDQLRFLPAGEVAPNPAEMLRSQRMRELLAALSDDSDFVILDLPPALAVADVVAVVGALDGVIVLARAGQTKQETLRHASEAITNVGGQIVGTILNGVDRRTGSYGHYDSYYGYHTEYYAPKPDDRVATSGQT